MAGEDASVFCVIVLPVFAVNSWVWWKFCRLWSEIYRKHVGKYFGV